MAAVLMGVMLAGSGAVAGRRLERREAAENCHCK